MNIRLAILGTTLALLAAPATAAVRLHAEPTSGKSALRALEDPSLLSHRAGAVPARVALDESERAVLRAAQATSAELGALRGGDVTLSDRDLTLIAIVAGVVLLIVILA